LPIAQVLAKEPGAVVAPGRSPASTRALAAAGIIAGVTALVLGATGAATVAVLALVGVGVGLAVGYTWGTRSRPSESVEMHQLAGRYAALLDGLHAAEWELVHASGQTVWADERIAEVSGYPRKRWISEPHFLVEHTHPDDSAAVRNELEAVAATGVSKVFEFRLVGDAKGDRWMRCVLRRSQERPGHLVGVMTDVTPEERDEALYDPVTGLPGLVLLTDRAERAVAAARRGRERVGVVAVQVRSVDEIVDRYGARDVNRLAIEIATRLSAALRESDTIARVAPGEFVIILPRGASHVSAVVVARKLQEILRRPVVMSLGSVVVSANVGIALHPDEAATGDELIRRARAAAAEAERLERGCLVAGPVPPPTPPSTELAASLQAAIDRGQIEVHYLPIADLRTSQIIAMEALVRWNHPRLGVLPPSAFLAVARAAGLSRALHGRVLADLLVDHTRWRAGGYDLDLSFNGDVALVMGERDDPWLLDRIADAGVPAGKLTIEITEHVLTSAPEGALDGLTRLRHAGMRVAIDDFGSTWSDATMIAGLPVDEVKIDRVFTRSLDTDPEADRVVSAMVTLGQELGLIVTAEGAEREPVLRALAGLGCDRAQGAAVGRPSPVADLDVLLARRARRLVR
jgi:diguanylate cyclase (GGDEF)-like protein